MQNSQISLSVNDILNKKFKTSLKGYHPDDVDKYLDIIIQDYEKFQQIITNLEQENQQLKKEVKKLSEQSPAPTQSLRNTNYDILQRLSNLEKEVFGRKIYE